LDVDDTVDLTSDTSGKGESEDTVSFTRPVGVWERLAGAVKKWTQGDRPDPQGKPQATDRERAKTEFVKQGDGPRG
jgi:hypothetical protein